MKKRYNLLIIVLTIAFAIYGGKTWAVHIQGGEITWECLTQGSETGKFNFKVRLYSRCNGIALPSFISITNPLYATYGGPSTISCSKVIQRSLNPIICYDSAMSMNCIQGSPYVTEESIYETSNAIQLNGIADTNGSAFIWSTCCRLGSPSSPNISGNQGLLLRAIMFPYKDPITGNFYSIGSSSGPSCYDSSPQLGETPSPLVCAKYPSRQDLYHYDTDLDSLYFEWSAAMSSTTNQVTYMTGYSDTNQLPNLNQSSSNVPASIDHQNGMIRFETHSPIDKEFNMCVAISSYRNGQKVATVFRDAPVIIIDCDASTSSPQVFNRNKPSIEIKEASSTVYRGSFADTFQVGSLIELDLRLQDYDSLPTNPVSRQSVQLFVTGDAMSADVNTDQNCKYKPCAYLDSIGNSAWTGYIFRDTSNMTVRFKWDTDCISLFRQNKLLNDSLKTYTFRVTAGDNWCPVPRDSVITFTITLIDTLFRNMHIDSLDASQGGAFLRWPVSKTKTFSSYNIYYRYRLTDIWNSVTAISNVNNTSYRHVSSRTDTSYVYYKVETNGTNNCDVFNIRSTYMRIKRNEYPFIYWYPPYPNDYDADGRYEVWRTDTNNTWQKIADVPFKGPLFNEGRYFYDNTLPYFGRVLKYKVIAYSNEGHVGVSNVDTISISRDPKYAGISGASELIVSIFPNPANDHITIQSAPSMLGSSARLLNANGSFCNEFVISKERQSIDLENLDNGLYFLIIEDKHGNIVSKKFLKD